MIAEAAFFALSYSAMNIIPLTFLVQVHYSLPSFLVPFYDIFMGVEFEIFAIEHKILCAFCVEYSHDWFFK